MTVHARRIASVPRRSSVDTWRTICDLIAPPGAPGRTELDAVTGVASMLIAEEYTRDAPITVSGAGPQIRIYTLHGEDAIDAELDDESGFAFRPTDGDWHLSLPCAADDLDDTATALDGWSRITVREMTGNDAASLTASAPRGVQPTIDLTELER